MRIIAGQWRGRKLVAPKGEATRPTADRTRETLFNMLASRLGSFAGLRVADLFAGSGALGLEAASRGADEVCLLERDPALVRALQATQARLKAAQVDIHRARTDCTAAGERHIGFTITRQQRPEHQDRGAHGFYQLVRSKLVVYFTGINLDYIVRKAHLCTK